MKNEGLVVSKAKTYWEGIYSTGMDKSLTQDDFIQLARIELWKAIAKFKPELGNKFSTYAGVCIDIKLKSVMLRWQPIQAGRRRADQPESLRWDRRSAHLP